MKVQVGDAIAGVFTDIEDETVAPLRQSVDGRDLTRRHKQSGHRLDVSGTDCASVGYVSTRDDEHVRGGGWIDVAKSDGERKLKHDGGGDGPIYDLAEQAVRIRRRVVECAWLAHGTDGSRSHE